MLHDKVIQKAVSMEKKQQKPSKRLQFSQLACGRQSSRYSDSQPSRSLPGKGSSLVTRLLLLPASAGRRKSFEGSLPPSQPQIGGIEDILSILGIPAEQRAGQRRFFVLGT